MTDDWEDVLELFVNKARVEVDVTQASFKLRVDANA